MPEPWVLGSSPTSAARGRISSMPRPSTRFCSSRSQRRTTYFWVLYMHSSIFASCSGYSGSKRSCTFSYTGLSLASLTVLSSVSMASRTSSSAKAFIASNISGSGSLLGYSNFSLPISALMPLINCKICWLASCPAIMPLYISSSETSFAPASIMAMRSVVEATVTAISLTLRCSASGLMINFPSISPTDTPDMGPLQGISEMVRAMEVPTIAAISGEQSWSTDITVQTMATSFLISLGNSGLMGRSIMRHTSVAFSLGRPSLLRNEPGILPTEYSFSSKSTESGKKSMPSLGFAEAVAATCTTVSPYRTRHSPFASWAILPVSTTRGRPAKSVS